MEKTTKTTNELKPRKERFRRHTKEKRKKENQRHRLKKRMEKKTRAEQEHEAIKVTVQAGKFTRGAMFLDLAKQQNQRKRPLKKEHKNAPPKKSKKEEALEGETKNQQRDESSRAKTTEPTKSKAADKKPKKAATFLKKVPAIVPRIRREDLADWPSNEDKDTDSNGGHVGSGSYGHCSKMLSSAIRAIVLATKEEWVVGFQNLSRTLSFVHSKKWLHNDIKQLSTYGYTTDSCTIADFKKLTLHEAIAKRKADHAVCDEHFGTDCKEYF